MSFPFAIKGRKPTLFQRSAHSYARPAAITLFTLRMSEITRSGRPATRIRSARLPASIVADSWSSFIALAGTIVADRIASIGVTPALT